MLSTNAAIGISQSAINKGFEKFSEAITTNLKGKDWKLEDATFGAPTISFLPNDQSRVRMTLKFLNGTLLKATVNIDTGTIDWAKHSLAGSDVSFEVVLERADNNEFHNKDFTAQAIYLRLTEITNIDAMSLGLSADDLSVMQDVMRGVVEKLQESHANQGFLISRIETPNLPDTVGALIPTSAAIASTCPIDKPEDGELDFLLMLKGRPLPEWANEHAQRGFDAPLTSLIPGKIPDAVLALSDRALLEAIAKPIIEQSFGGMKLKSDEAPNAGRLFQSENLKLKERGMYAKGLEAKLLGSSIHISLDLVMEEALRAGDGPAGVDFSIVKVVIRKNISFDINFSINSYGLLEFTVVEGSGNRNTPKYELQQNFQVKSPADIVKWLSVIALPFLDPVAGSLVAIYVGTVATIAQAIQSGVVDAMKLAEHATSGLGPLNGIDAQIELPGDPVFLFSSIAPMPNTLLIAADVAERPVLASGQINPFSLPRPPRVEPGQPMPTDRTEPQLIGETALHYRHVNDPRFLESTRRQMPYYILRREQFWHRIAANEYPAHEQRTSTVETINRVQTTHHDSMAQTLKLDVSINGTLELLAAFTPEFSMELSNELQVEISNETEHEKTDTITKEIVMEARDTPYGVAVWVLIDRYTLQRADKDRSIVAQWDYAIPDVDQVDDYNIAEREIDTSGETE